MNDIPCPGGALAFDGNLNPPSEWRTTPKPELRCCRECGGCRDRGSRRPFGSRYPRRSYRPPVCPGSREASGASVCGESRESAGRDSDNEAQAKPPCGKKTSTPPDG